MSLILLKFKIVFSRTKLSIYYTELSFHEAVYPLKLEIYETYNPGCVVKILACDRSEDTDVDTGHRL